MKFTFKILIFGFTLITSLFSLGQNPVNEQYKNTPDGEVIEYWSNGQTAVICTIVNSNIEGERRTYYKSGELLQIENFENGLFHGKVISFRKNGDTTHVEFYAHDTLRVLRENWYYRNGRVKTTQIITFIEDSTLKTTPINIREIGTYGKMNHRETIKATSNTSKRINYYKNGKIKSISRHNNEDLEGTQQYFYKTGKLMLQYSYKNGKKNGTCLEYDEQGRVTKTEEYVNDELVK